MMVMGCFQAWKSPFLGTRTIHILWAWRSIITELFLSLPRPCYLVVSTLIDFYYILFSNCFPDHSLCLVISHSHPSLKCGILSKLSIAPQSFCCVWPIGNCFTITLALWPHYTGMIVSTLRKTHLVRQSGQFMLRVSYFIRNNDI